MNKITEAVFLVSNGSKTKKKYSTSVVKYNEELEKAKQKIIQETEAKVC